jgi:hypothetical protein
MPAPFPADSSEQAIRQRTARLLRDRDPALADMLDAQASASALNVVEVRAVVVRLRHLMMDATFDDTHIAAHISETSELYEWWHQYLSQVG